MNIELKNNENIASLQCLLCGDTFPWHCCVLALVTAVIYI